MGMRIRFNSAVKKASVGPKFQLVMVVDGNSEVLTEFESPVASARNLMDMDVECTELADGLMLSIKAILAGPLDVPVAEPVKPVKRKGRPPGSLSKKTVAAAATTDVEPKVKQAKKEVVAYVEKVESYVKPAMDAPMAEPAPAVDDRRTKAADAAKKVMDDARKSAKSAKSRETFEDGDGRTIDAATGEVLSELDKTLGGGNGGAPAPTGSLF